MTRRASALLSLLARALVVLVLVAGVCVGTLPMWAPSLVSARLEAMAAERGIALRVRGLSLSFSGRIEVAELHASRDAVRMDCTQVRVDAGSWRTLSASRRVENVVVRSCALTDDRQPDATAPPEEPEDTAAEATELERLIARLRAEQPRARAMASRADRWRIDSLHVESPRVRVSLESLRVNALGDYIDVETSVAVSSPLRAVVPGLQLVWRPDGSIRATTEGPVEVPGVAVQADRFELTAEGELRVEAGQVSTELPVVQRVAFASLSVAGPRACPRVALEGAEVRMGAGESAGAGHGFGLASLGAVSATLTAPDPGGPDHAAAGGGAPEPPAVPLDDDLQPGTVAPTTRAGRRGRSAANDVMPPEALDADAPAGPPLDGRERLLSIARLVSAIDRQARRVGALPRPCADLSLRGTRIDLGGPQPVLLDELVLLPDGALQATLSFDGVAITIDTSLRDLTAVSFSAGPVDIAPLGAWLGERTRLGGEATANGTLSRASDGRLRFEGSLSLVDVLFERAAVSPHALEGMNVEGTLVIEAGNEDAPGLHVRAEGTLQDIPLSLQLDVVAEDRESWRMNFAFRVREETRCQRLYEAIPAGLLPNLGHTAFRYVGAAAPELRFTYRIGDPWSFQFQAEGFPGTCEVQRADRMWDPRQLLSDRYVHHVVEGSTLPDLLVGPGTPSWVPIESVPGWVPAVMYLSEEIHFFTNPGISLPFIARAVSRNLERNRYSSGGSTVSQQLVKNLFLSRAKSLSRKLEEILIVWAMEQWVPKGRILELYMNCIEFGPDIYGIRAAAEHYFGVRPEDLTPLEAAFLASLKPSPLAGARYRQQGHSHVQGWWPNRLREILIRLVRYGGFITRAEADAWAPWVVAFPTSPNYGANGYERRARPAWAEALPLVRIGHEGILGPPLPEDFDPGALDGAVDAAKPIDAGAPTPIAPPVDTPAPDRTPPVPDGPPNAPAQETTPAVEPASTEAAPSAEPASPSSTFVVVPVTSMAPPQTLRPAPTNDTTRDEEADETPAAVPPPTPRPRVTPEEALRGLRRAP